MNARVEHGDAKSTSPVHEPITRETASDNVSGDQVESLVATVHEVAAVVASEDVRAELDRARAELTAVKDQLAAAERQREMDRELTAAGAIDTETVSMLVEAMVARGEAQSVVEAVGRIRQRKAFLFTSSRSAGAMGRRVESTDALEGAADVARRAGDRRSLMQYLKVRRSEVSAS